MTQWSSALSTFYDRCKNITPSGESPLVYMSQRNLPRSCAEINLAVPKRWFVKLAARMGRKCFAAVDKSAAKRFAFWFSAINNMH